jgi:PHD/YefM family antitoxin component YafN of YafNO toxin-antitoxin module
MGTTQNSLSLDEFRDNVNGFVHDVAQQSEPILIQPADGPSVVLQNAERYQQIVDRLEHFEFVEAVREGLRAEQEGRLYPAFEALAELQNKLGLPD